MPLDADADTDADDEVREEEPAEAAPTKKAAPAKKKRQPKKKKAKASEQPEPENAEEQDDNANTSDPEQHEVNPSTLSMFELSHDTRHGKVSEREKKMAEIDWDEVARKRREAIERTILGEQQLSLIHI